MSAWVSERVNFQSSSLLNWFIKLWSNHFQPFLPLCMKRFTTKGKQTLSHFLEKLLITKAIYQLNKYNKAWLNTNLAKTPTLFTVEFQELLEMIVLKNVLLQFTGIFYLHLYSYSSLAKTWLSIRNRISSRLKVFHIMLYLTVFRVTFCFLSESIDSERKSLTFKCHTWNRGICGDIRTYIFTS